MTFEFVKVTIKSRFCVGPTINFVHYVKFSLNLIPAFGQLFNQKEEIQDHQEWFENNSTNKRWK